MAPRNNDANTSYKKKNFPVEDTDVDVKDAVPCLLHKKHKVVKLIKSQIQQIQEEGLICASAGLESDAYYIEENEQKTVKSKPGTSKTGRFRRAEGEEVDLNNTENRGGLCLCLSFLAFLLGLFLVTFLMVWISAGPLSNSTAHTPIPASSFIRTEGLCSLEKKYLLRWSKPEYFE